MKKAYEKPAIVHTEKVEARAVACTGGKASSTDPMCTSGPISS